MTNHGPRAFATERLDALPLRIAHADEMAVVLGDPALHTYTGGAPESADELRARYGRQTAGSPCPLRGSPGLQAGEESKLPRSGALDRAIAVRAIGRLRPPG